MSTFLTIYATQGKPTAVSKYFIFILNTLAYFPRGYLSFYKYMVSSV